MNFGIQKSLRQRGGAPAKKHNIRENAARHCRAIFENELNSAGNPE
ncbi:MAG: hypothetical protein PHP98_04505 [Kiritimatiellae bacterium]|nr:hypothetical protein [Kiritimatiellia bacterium]